MDVFVPAGGRMWTTEQSMLSRRSTGVTIAYCFSFTSELCSTGYLSSNLLSLDFLCFLPLLVLPTTSIINLGHRIRGAFIEADD